MVTIREAIATGRDKNKQAKQARIQRICNKRSDIPWSFSEFCDYVISLAEKHDVSVNMSSNIRTKKSFKAFMVSEGYLIPDKAGNVREFLDLVFSRWQSFTASSHNFWGGSSLIVDVDKMINTSSNFRMAFISFMLVPGNKESHEDYLSLNKDTQASPSSSSKIKTQWL